MHQIVYISRAAQGVGVDDLTEMVNIAQARNLRDEITGLLVFDGSRFMQVLEGPTNHVHATLTRIKLDRRHFDLVVMRDCDVAKREFGFWSMRSRFIHDIDDAVQFSQEIKDMMEWVGSADTRAAFLGFAGLARLAFSNHDRSGSGLDDAAP